MFVCFYIPCLSFICVSAFYGQGTILLSILVRPEQRARRIWSFPLVKVVYFLKSHGCVALTSTISRSNLCITWVFVQKAFSSSYFPPEMSFHNVVSFPYLSSQDLSLVVLVVLVFRSLISLPLHLVFANPPQRCFSFDQPYPFSHASQPSSSALQRVLHSLYRHQHRLRRRHPLLGQHILPDLDRHFRLPSRHHRRLWHV